MKKVLLGLMMLVGLIVAGPRECPALTIGERILAVGNSFAESPKVAIGESVDLVYAYALPQGGNAGTHRTGAIMPIFYWGVLSADGGLLSGDLTAPAKETAAPLLGGSLHVDYLLALMFPEIGEIFQGFIPGTAQKLVFRIQLGVGIAHDFNAQKTLPTLYAGPKVSW